MSTTIVGSSSTNSDRPLNVILETKGYDPLKDVKRQAAERWVAAVNADGRFGRWQYVLIAKIADVSGKLTELARTRQTAA